MELNDLLEFDVPEGNPLPGDDPDEISPVGDPVPTEPTDPGGDPSF